MNLELFRIGSGNDSTLGVLYERQEDGRHLLCFTLEDEFRAVKRPKETRIPAGTYPLALRDVGRLHPKYAAQFPDIHQGMLWVQNVPGFEWVYLHVGNRDDDTEGCILVGDSLQQNVTEAGFLGSSRAAYRRVYPLIATAIPGGVTLTITNLDSPP
ncbi:hypothetical protein LCGC14_1785020 [marine sediment metagenome]|uniref:DUF5675 domain-containing protein n=1 Tax=marine sediment metagenome TaxID=412755 RepID=A0A0F9GU88_9ZZZZ